MPTQPTSARPAARPRTPPRARSKSLVLELGCEELPPRAQVALSQAFAEHIYHALRDAGLVDSTEQYQAYATPRRLAVWLGGVLPKQVEQIEQKLGPRLTAAYDRTGNPTPAAHGFARACGVTVAALQVQDERLVFHKKVRGARLATIVSAALHRSIKALPIPKRMRWGTHAVEFVRPVHWLLALYGSDLLRTEVLGLKSGKCSYGHRFHHPQPLIIPTADRYLSTLKTNGYVIADVCARRAHITRQAQRLAVKNGGRAVLDDDLLAEVTGLVEWPVALCGDFARDFIDLPSAVLIATMQVQQKYFHVVDADGRLLPKFIAMSNIKSKSPKRVRLGYERVLQARLADAQFFWRRDHEKKLDARTADLKTVLFHHKLGSVYDKCQRIQGLAVDIAARIGADVEQTRTAARVCKADLTTDMVGEFPQLQGVMGKYYARAQGLDPAIATAIEQHYWPRFAGDQLPNTAIGVGVALADRLDSLVGLFANNEIPSGDKDPFALRRAALAVLRILIEGKLDLDLCELLTAAIHQYHASPEALNDTTATAKTALVDLVQTFIFERLKGYFSSYFQSLDGDARRSAAGLPAVLACAPPRPWDIALRLMAVHTFFHRQQAAAQSLVAANKRIAKLLHKIDHSGTADSPPNATYFQATAEKALAAQVASLQAQVRAHCQRQQYQQGLELLAELATPVDTFFDEVMVLHEDPNLRHNRIALLRQIRALFLEIADIAQVSTD